MDSREPEGASAPLTQQQETPASEAPEFFVTDGSRTSGPFSKPELLRLLNAGEVSARCLVYKEGWPTWKSIESVFHLVTPGQPRPLNINPPTSTPPLCNQANVRSKSRFFIPESSIGRRLLLAVVLGIFLSFLIAGPVESALISPLVFYLMFLPVRIAYVLISDGLKALFGGKVSQAAPPRPPAPRNEPSVAAEKTAQHVPAATPSTFHQLLKYGTICFCAFLAFLVAIAVLFPGTSSSPNPTAPPVIQAVQPPAPPPPPQPLKPEQIAERLRQSTVRIDASFKVKGTFVDDKHGWLGSGVIVDQKDGVCWVISNAHVVGLENIFGSKMFIDAVVLEYTLVVTLPDGAKVKPDRVLINRNLKDFAVLGFPSSSGRYTALLSHENKLPQGQKVYAMGHPLGLNGTFTSGVISSWRTMTTKLNRRYEVIQTDASINPGNSGGPLVDDFANLIGINTFVVGRNDQAQGLNFAVSMREISRSISNDEMIRFPLEPSRIGPFVKAINQGAYAK